MATVSGQAEAAEPLLDAAERAPAGSAEEPFQPRRPGGQLAGDVPVLTTLLRSYLADTEW